MPESYTRDTFSRSIVPTGFRRETVALIEHAANWGWTVQIAGTHVTLISPGDTKRFNLSTGKTSGPIRGMRRAIESRGVRPTVPPKPAASQPEPPTPAPEAVPPADPTPPEKELPVPQPAGQAPPTLVSEIPMISKHGVGKGYTSDIATQREWSDGTINYACVRGDYIGDSPRAMGSHWGKHVREDERNRGNHAGVTVTVEPTPYTPNEDRLASLTEHLAGIIDASTSAEDLARAALEWENARRQKAEAEREPLTDSEVLAKIRGLVDNGLYDSLNGQLDQLRAENTRLTAELVEAQTKAQSALDNIAALRDLLGEAS